MNGGHRLLHHGRGDQEQRSGGERSIDKLSSIVFSILGDQLLPLPRLLKFATLVEVVEVAALADGVLLEASCHLNPGCVRHDDEPAWSESSQS